jgi:hypothetical protein
MQEIVWSMENEGFVGDAALARCCRLVFCNGILSMRSGEAISARVFAIKAATYTVYKVFEPWFWTVFRIVGEERDELDRNPASVGISLSCRSKPVAEEERQTSQRSGCSFASFLNAI